MKLLEKTRRPDNLNQKLLKNNSELLNLIKYSPWEHFLFPE
jgi:hypothetical protein